jgi:DNA-binding transcriptional MerR regulator
MAEQRGGSGTYLSIGEVLALLHDEFPDVTISKIRFLESQGLIDPERTPSGYRKFYDGDVERLRFILHEQKEHFLPLKVIKDRLDSGEPGIDDNGSGGTDSDDSEQGLGEAADGAPVEGPAADGPGDEGSASAPAEERVPIWMVRTPPAPAAPRAVSTYSFEEAATAAGLSAEELREVERFGLVIGRVVAGDTLYDEHAVVAARVAGQFLRFGIEPRHLRLYRNAADREAGLIEQVIMPWVKQRNPQARAQARTSLEELARLGAELHEAILRQSLRPYIEG